MTGERQAAERGQMSAWGRVRGGEGKGVGRGPLSPSERERERAREREGGDLSKPARSRLRPASTRGCWPDGCMQGRLGRVTVARP